MSLTLYAPAAAAPPGFQYLPNGGLITPAVIAAAQAEGFVGAFLDPRIPNWSMAGLVIKDFVNFGFSQGLGPPGSIGYNANIAAPPFPIQLGSGADGIQIYSDAVSPCQGIYFAGCGFLSQNTNGGIHFGGRQRACLMRDCFVENNSGLTTTVAAGSNAVNVNTFTGTQTLSTGVLPAGWPSSGTVIVQTTNGGQPGLAQITFSGAVAGTANLPNCTWTSNAAGTLTTGNPVQLIQAAIIYDTALGSTNPNSEDSSFDNVYAVSSGGGIAVGVGNSTPVQNPNDTEWRLTTACPGGMASLALIQGGNHKFKFYDRTPASSAPLATVWNDGVTAIFETGEDQNNGATGISHLVDGGSAITRLQDRNVTKVTATNVAVITAGGLICRGRTRLQGTVIIQGGTLDIADSAGQYGSGTPLVPSGTAGTLVVAGSYPAPGSAAPSLAGFTGTVNTGPM